MSPVEGRRSAARPTASRPGPSLTSISPFDAAAIVVVLAAAFTTLNVRFVGLPQTIGLTAAGALMSAVTIGAAKLAPGLHIDRWARGFIDGLDFRSTLLDGMLSFLLFAGALQIEAKDARAERWPILVLAIVGTVLSTLLVGAGTALLLRLAGFSLPLSWCFLFGALISPTDPVAVIAILKDAWLPPAIQATVASESLFNDGVGVVIFTVVLAAATGQGDTGALAVTRLFAQQAGGGLAFGVALGALTFVALRTTTDFVAETLVTLACAMGGYALAKALHVSGPVAMAAAGLIVGDRGFAFGLGEMGRDYVVKFWLVIDEILNAVLFLLVGLEAIAVWGDNGVTLVALGAIPVVLAARLLSVGLPLLLLTRIRNLGPAAIPILWWGGLRGGLSIAMALSVPPGAGQELLLAMTYATVFFSVLVQGSTIGRLARRFAPDDGSMPAPARFTPP